MAVNVVVWIGLYISLMVLGIYLAYGIAWVVLWISGRRRIGKRRGRRGR